MNGAVKDILEYFSKMTYCVAITTNRGAGHIDGLDTVSICLASQSKSFGGELCVIVQDKSRP